jgi:hypothetical protein
MARGILPWVEILRRKGLYLPLWQSLSKPGTVTRTWKYTIGHAHAYPAMRLRFVAVTARARVTLKGGFFADTLFARGTDADLIGL